MDDDYEQVLLVKQDVFVYKIPPRSSISRAHRASDWKLDQPDWKGRLRLVLKGPKCILKLEDKENCKLFAECFIENFPGSDVESVSDSSRYFVIKIKNPNDGRVAFIGIGFEDRSDSFDLNVALQDHFKRISSEKDQVNNFGNEDDTPKIDLSLKEGQTIKVNLNIGKKSTSSTRPKPKASSSNSMGILLPPPPSGSICSKNQQTTTFKQSSQLVDSNIDSSDNKDNRFDILSFDSPQKEKSKNVLDEFDNLNFSSSKDKSSNALDDFDNLNFSSSKDKPRNVLDEFDNLNFSSNSNDDWSNFESYQTTKPTTDQSEWATFT